MQQQNALIGVAMAAYFPTISLSGLAGYSGTFPLLTADNSLVVADACGQPDAG